MGNTPDAAIRVVHILLGNAEAEPADLDSMSQIDESTLRDVERFFGRLIDDARHQRSETAKTESSPVQKLWHSLQAWRAEDSSAREPAFTQLRDSLSDAIRVRIRHRPDQTKIEPGVLRSLLATVIAWHNNNDDAREYILGQISRWTREARPMPTEPAAAGARELDPCDRGEQAPTVTWRDEPVRSNLNRHPLQFCHECRGAHDTFLVGARVRGRKHKHDGTNCDDWFELKCTPDWNLVAVSDGAGSRPFSRIGARTACEAAIAALESNLPKRTGEPAALLAADIEPAVRNIVANAVEKAIGCVRRDAESRTRLPEYREELGRQLSVDDFAATLLLAAHTRIATDAGIRDLVVAVQIGDGACIGLRHDYGIEQLGKADAGEFAGETEFLLSPRMATREAIYDRVTCFVGELRALLVATDGVADDYLPPIEGANVLLADLQLNGILKPHELLQDPLLDETAPLAGDVIARARYAIDRDSLSPHTAQPPDGFVSARKLASELNLEPSTLVQHAAIVKKHVRRGHSEDKSSATLLERWLATYYIRGSFDDRTLIALVSDRVRIAAASMSPTPQAPARTMSS